MIIKTNWKLNTNNDFELVSIENQANNSILTMQEMLFADNTYYVDNLSRFGVYFMHFLLQNGYKSVTELKELKQNTFFTTMHAGECNSFLVQTKNGLVRLLNFSKKFGVDFAGYEQNQMLVDYAEQQHRYGNSIGADAYDELLATIWGGKTNNLINRELMRRHYPIIKDKLLKEAKKHTSGVQLYTRGKYSGVYNYDQQSAYPSQLLSCTPTGKPIYTYKTIEKVPKTYWYIVKIAFFNLQLTAGFDWLALHKTNGYIVLTKELYALFLETYSADVLVKEIVAFKTIKGRFDKFINKNVLDGKMHATNRVIAKYNKYIANSVIGYMGRNTATKINKFTWSKGKCAVKQCKQEIDPIYLPVYLFVQGKQKAEFVRTLNRYDGIIYANTDGFFTTNEINTERLNARYTTDLGAYKYKCEYAELYINSINGYVGITTEGEIDNCLAGMSMDALIYPGQYEQQQFTYHLDQVTNSLVVHRTTIQQQRN